MQVDPLQSTARSLPSASILIRLAALAALAMISLAAFAAAPDTRLSYPLVTLLPRTTWSLGARGQRGQSLWDGRRLTLDFTQGADLGDVFGVEFEPVAGSQSWILALWSATTNATAMVSTTARRATLVNTVGETQSLRAGKGFCSVTLPAGAPVFLITEERPCP
jgi:hypothetical protein